MPPVKKEEMIKFQLEIEAIVSRTNLSYLDAIMEFITDSDIEIERIPKILSDNLLAKLQREAEDLSLLKVKTKRRLPLS